MNRSKTILLTVIALVVFHNSNAQFQLPPIDIKIQGGYSSQEPFDYLSVDDKDFKVDVFQIGLGFDVWITRSISIGYIGSFPIASSAEFRDLARDEYTPFTVDASYHVLKANYSSNQENRFSFYGGVGLHYLQHYYETYDFGRKATGVSGNGGVVLKFGAVRVLIAELTIAYLDKSLFSDSHNSNLFFSLNSGVAIRVLDPK